MSDPYHKRERVDHSNHSPTQLNSLILDAVGYSFVGHAHALLCCAVAVTQAHEHLSQWLYCRTIAPSSSLL